MYPPLPPPPRPPVGGDRHLAQQALKVLGAKGAREDVHKAPEAPKLIYTVILWYGLAVQSPLPPPPLRDRHFMTVPRPPMGGITRGGGRNKEDRKLQLTFLL